jgi:TRAP-type transport system periplasmic protein
MLLVIPVLWSGPGGEALAQTITLRGPSQFADDHSYNQGVLRFAEQVQKCYGKPINFILHRTRDPGLEEEYFM